MAAQTVHGQQRERKQNAVAEVRNAEDVRESFEELHCLLALLAGLALLARAAPALNDFCLAAGSLDLLPRRLRKQVRAHGDGALDVAGAEYLQPVLQLANDAEFAQAVHVERIAL